MNIEIFHLIFVLSFTTMLVIRILAHSKTAGERDNVELKESKLNMLVRAFFGIGYILGLLIYIFYPTWLKWAIFPLPQWVRWSGGAISVGSVLLLWWVQRALDVQFHTTLHTQDDHQLIKHGPYRWVRHPMYTVLFLMGIGWLLLTANWLIGAPLAMGILVLILVRIDNEEKVLIDLFGDDYLEYMQHTGRFLPRVDQSG